MTAKAVLDTTSPFGSYRASTGERLVWRLADWSPLPQALRRRLRKRFARPVAGPFDIDHEGMKFRLYPAENYCDRVLFGRGELPERAEHEALDQLIRPGMVLVDIGANVGSYSIYAGTRAGGDLTLIALEPHPRTFEKLLFNLQANKLPTNDVINGAVGPHRDTMTLWSDGGSNIGHTSLLAEGTAHAKVGIEVDVLPLVEILRDRRIAAIDLLKIDIEGYEDRALAPFLSTAEESLLPRHILIETVHRRLWETDLDEILARRGYKERFATAENRLLERHSS